MTHWLLTFFGIDPAVSGEEIVRMALSLRHRPMLPWALLAAAAVGALAFWLYRRGNRLPLSRQVFLAALRTALVLLLLIALLRPLLRLDVQGEAQRSLLILVDRSLSMSLADLRTDEADLNRARLLFPATSSADPPAAERRDSAADPSADPSTQIRVKRVDLVKAALTDQRLSLLQRLAAVAQPRVFAFDSQVNELTLRAGIDLSSPPSPALGQWLSDELAPRGASTAAGAAMSDALSRLRGQPLVGVVLITDGRSNAGPTLDAAAALARQNDIPIYAWGVGVTTVRDVAAVQLSVPDTVFVDDEVTASVRIRSTGLAGETVDLVLRDGEQILERRPVTLVEGEQSVEIQHTPGAPGRLRLAATLETAAIADAVADNNAAAAEVRVIDSKIRILLVERQPRWEFKYLTAMLRRDQRINLDVVLMEADPQLASADDSPYLASFPSTEATLFEYDLIVLGDIDPAVLTARQLALIERFVSEIGGGLVLIAGRRHMPGSFWDSPLAAVMPVEPPGQGATTSNRPIYSELTFAGRNAEPMLLDDDADLSGQVWRTLPPLYWAAPVGRARPAAETWLVDPADDRRVGNEPMPLIVMQPFGVGHVLFVGTDNTWRWRRNTGEALHARLWGQFVQRLAMPKLIGQNKRVQVAVDRRRYDLGQPVIVTARVFDRDYRPVDRPSLSVSVSATPHALSTGGAAPGAAPSSTVMSLRPIPGQPGRYRGDFTPADAGVFRVSVDLPADTDEPAVPVEFTVAESTIELSEPSMDLTSLTRITALTGGVVLREEDLPGLPDLIARKFAPVLSSYSVELASTPAYFVLLLAVACTEWAVRKRLQLR